VSGLLFPQEQGKMFGIAISGALGNSHATSDIERYSLVWDYWNIPFCLFWGQEESYNLVTTYEDNRS